MARYTPPGSLNSILAINAELEKISEAFEDTVSRKNDSPNQLEGDLDLNGNSLLNLKSDPNNPDSILLKKDVYTKEETDELLEDNRDYTDQREANIRADFSEGITGATVVVYPDVASLEASEPTQTGQRAEVVERANVQYITADVSYNPTAADVTAANGRVWKLVHNGVIYSEWFGLDYDALNTCIQYAGLFGAKVYTSTDVDFAGSTLSIPSGVKVIGVGKPSWTNAKVTVGGTSDTPINITSEVSVGDESIQIGSTSGLAGGDWIKVVSSLNSNSPDAGDLRLGDRVSNNSQLSEFAQIKRISGSTLELVEKVLWRYPTTASPDTPSGITTSYIVPVEFNTDAKIEGIHISGNYSEYIVKAELCKNFKISQCEVIADDWGCVEFKYCYNSGISGGKVTQTLYENSVGAQNIPLVFVSSSYCYANGGLEVYGGYQGIDTTYKVGDSNLYGGPSISCVVENTVVKGCSVDGITSHPGGFASRFVNNTVYGGSVYGIRSRSIQDYIAGNTIYGGASSTTGIGLTETINKGTVVEGNTIYNCLTAVGQSSKPIYDYSKSAIVRNNSAYGCSYGFITAFSDATALKVGTVVEGNSWYSSSENSLLRGVSLSSYSNGIEVEGNRSYGATEAGVRYNTNISNLRIIGNKSYEADATSFGVRGPSTSSFMTNLTTFPLGEDEANLKILGNYQQGGTDYAGIYRISGDAFGFDNPAGYQQSVQPISDSPIASLERGVVNLYVDTAASPDELRAKLNIGGTTYDVLLSQLT